MPPRAKPAEKPARKKKIKPETDTDSTPKQTVWSKSEEDRLVERIVEELAQAGDGGSMKMSVWTKIAADIPSAEGAVKTGSVCKSKYSRLKATWKTVAEIIDNSGWVWDTELGANITPELEPIWEDYLRAHPSAEPFRNSGWRHEAAFRLAVPRYLTRAPNSNVVRLAADHNIEATGSTRGGHGSHRGRSLTRAAASSVPRTNDNNAELEEPSELEHLPRYSPDWVTSSEDDQDEQDIPASATPPVSTPSPRKRASTVTPLPEAPNEKRSRSRGKGSARSTPTIPAADQRASAVLEVNETVKSLQQTMHQIVAGPAQVSGADTPSSRATQRAQRLEGAWLTPSQLIDFIDIFIDPTNGPSYASQYLALDESNLELRKLWVLKRLRLQAPAQPNHSGSSNEHSRMPSNGSLLMAGSYSEGGQYGPSSSFGAQEYMLPGPYQWE